MARMMVIFDPTASLDVPLTHRDQLGLGMAVLDMLDDAPPKLMRETGNSLVALVVKQIEDARKRYAETFAKQAEVDRS
jgi:hypothetical protein